MKEKIAILMALCLFICCTFGLSSCKKNEISEKTTTTTAEEKSSTSEPVKIVEVPKGNKEILKAFNAALDYVDVFCYNYTKETVCKQESLSLGSLSAVSNARSAFESVFRVSSQKNDFNYKQEETRFKDNFPVSGFTESNISGAQAKLKGDYIILDIDFISVTNPNEKSGFINLLTTDYVMQSDVEASLKDFDSSAAAVNTAVNSIHATAKISKFDSSLNQLTVSFNEQFILTDVVLVEMDKASVTGTTKTEIKYTNITT